MARIIAEFDFSGGLRVDKIARVINHLDFRLRVVKIARVSMTFEVFYHLSRAPQRGLVPDHLDLVADIELGVGEGGVAGQFAVRRHDDARRCHSWLRHFAFDLIGVHQLHKFLRFKGYRSSLVVEVRSKCQESLLELT